VAAKSGQFTAADGLEIVKPLRFLLAKAIWQEYTNKLKYNYFTFKI